MDLIVWPIIYFICDWWWIVPVGFTWAFIGVLTIAGGMELARGWD